MQSAQTFTDLYNGMQLRQNITDANGKILIPNVHLIIENICDRIQANKSRYQTVSRHFPAEGFKYYIVGIIHYLECNLNFNCYLGNGEPINRVTTIEPIGRGPFQTFEDGAIDALSFHPKVNDHSDWSIGGTLQFFEMYNGDGYEKFHGINSPYLWSGSNQYVKGKYPSDGKYDPEEVSQEIGAALLLQKMLQFNQS